MKYCVTPFFNETECKTFMEYYDSQPAERIANDYVTLSGKVINRDQDVLSITDREDIYTYFEQRLQGIHKEICDSMQIFGNYLKRFYTNWCKHHGILAENFTDEDNKIKTYELFLSKYSLGKYCAPHKDTTRIGRMFTEWYWQKYGIPRELWHDHPRLYTVSITLNSDYEGGELYIYDDNNNPVRLKSSPGDIVVMEPDRLHEVTKVTAGNRYTIISWAYLDHHSFVPAGSVNSIFDLPDLKKAVF